MDKCNGIDGGFLILSLLFSAAAIVICICLQGYCTEDWLPKNLIICGGTEVFLFIYGIAYVRRTSKNFLSKAYGLVELKEFYQGILYLMGFGICYALILFAFPCLLYTERSNDPDPVMLYALNIMVPSLVFFIWMGIEISKINKLLKD